MSKRTAFEDLQVYQLSEQLSDIAWSAIQKWPYLEKDTIGKQLVRASDSVGANIAEGSGRGTFKDNSRFAKIARGSLFEVKHWLRRAFRQKLLSGSAIKEFQDILDILTPKLSAYINYLEKK
jgi:four helix bundle protein